MRSQNPRKRIKKRVNKPSSNLKEILPSPSALESYEEIHPNFTKELLQLARREQDKHYNLEKFKAIVRFLGKMLTFILVLSLICALIIAINNNNHKMSLGLLGVIFIISLPQLLSILSVFVKPKKTFKKNYYS